MREYLEKLASDYGVVMAAYLLMMLISAVGLMGFYCGYYMGVTWFMMVSAFMTMIYRWMHECEEVVDKE